MCSTGPHSKEQTTVDLLAPYPTAEMRMLADAILLHRPLPLHQALRRALEAAGEYVPDADAPLLCAYADALDFAMLLDGYRYVSRDNAPLLGLGPLEVFEDATSGRMLTRCAVWYGPAALIEWARRGGK